MSTFIKSPLNYTGGKTKILPQIIPLFPDDINVFIDLFAGGANVGINVNADKVVFNDNIEPLINLYKTLQQNSVKKTVDYLEQKIEQFGLSETDGDAYLTLRKCYNDCQDPLLLFLLTAYSFNHQIRFNNARQYNVPFGKQRSSFNSAIKANLVAFMNKLHSINAIFIAKNFDELDLGFLGKRDFVYADPPYLITTGTYNDGKRGFTGWGKEQEIKLLDLLDNLDKKGIRFALSNVIKHKKTENKFLLDWLKKNEHYHVHNIVKDYANSSYNVKNKDKEDTQEVLITNY